MSNQLNRKQSTLCFHTSSRILTNRPGPKVKAPTTLTAASSAALIFGVRRRKVGGVNEAEVIKAFKDSRAHHAIGEPDSGDDADEYSSDGDHRPRKKFKRTGYSREKKLQAITYFELTDMPGKIVGSLTKTTAFVFGTANPVSYYLISVLRYRIVVAIFSATGMGGGDVEEMKR
jgi:hypothetical protein